MAGTEKTKTIVLTGLMMCLVLTATYFLKIATPFQGYVHMGDAMIFLSVLVLGKKNGALAAGIGSALADLLGGYVAFIPWTLVIKALMAYIMGLFIEIMVKKHKTNLKIGGVPVIELVGMFIAGAVMVVGYAFADAFIAGNWYTGILSMPANCGQFLTGIIVAGVLSGALYKTPAKKYFQIRLDEAK